MDDVVTVQATQPAGLLLEFFQLLIVLCLLLRIAYANGDMISFTLVHAAHIELLDSHLFVEAKMSNGIGIAKTTRCKMFVYAIGTVEYDTDGQHIGFHCLYLVLKLCLQK